MILEYPPIVVPEMLKEWNMVITSVIQEYKFTEDKQDYRIESGITYRGRGAFMNIGKSKYNYNKDRKLRCFNCNIYRYIIKDCQKPEKEKGTRKCYKYNKVGYFTKKLQIRTEDKEQKHIERFR